MAYLVVEKWNKENEDRQYELDKGITRIGCPTPDNTPDFSIDDRYVSRKHLEISYDHDHFVLQDVGSLNGTQLDGKLVKAGRLYPLDDMCTIGLAVISDKPRIVLRFYDSELGTIPGRKGESNESPVEWLRIDDDRKQAYVDEQPVKLSKKEYLLIKYLFSRAQKNCSRDDIILQVWYDVQDPRAVGDSALEALVHRLRLAVEINPANPKRIVTVRDFGYMLC
jgi:hypothetical protein